MLAAPVDGQCEESAPAFPVAIQIKTPTRTFNLFFYFALDGAGMIWFKSIPGASAATNSVAPEWRVFGTGLPHNETKKEFVSPRRIESINADLDELMAVSDDHRMYSLRWFENPVFKEDIPAGTWGDVHGWPVHGPLSFDQRLLDNRGWAIGRRTRSFVLFEDIAGRTFDGGGGLSTYYVLSADGTSIAFSDSGLPPDFSHTIGGPDRSTFVAEAMEVCADTIFLVNAYGDLRTRMIDFDTDGSDTMFFVYSYDRKDPRPDAIAIPAEGWFVHKPIPLEGQAQIASRLAIVLTGKHNRDRELRVAGFDRSRRPGYYAKRIFDQELGSPVRTDADTWRFTADDSITIDPARLLDPAYTDPDSQRATTRTAIAPHTMPPHHVASRDMAFTGELCIAKTRVEVTAEILDFNLEWSPARLVFTSGGTSVEATFHTSEKWFHLLRFDPGHDGTPKEFQATLELTPAARATEHPVLRTVVAALTQFHLVAFAWFVQATEAYLDIESKPEADRPLVTLKLLRGGRGYASLASARRIALRQHAFTDAARVVTLCVGKPLLALTTADLAALREAVARNLEAAATFVIAAEAPERQDAATPKWLRPSLLGALRHIARPWLIGVVLPLLPFRNISKTEAAYYAKNLATNLPLLLARSRALKEVLLGYAQRDLAHALMIMDTRIAAYTKRIAQLAGTAADRPFSYSEDLAGFWRPLRFDRATLEGLPPVSAGWSTVRDDEMFTPRPDRPPGLVIDIVRATSPDRRMATLTLRIVPTSLERDYFHASLDASIAVGGLGNPLRTPVRVQIDAVERAPATQSMIDAIFSTPVLAASQDAPAELTVEGASYTVVGAGFVLSWRHT